MMARKDLLIEKLIEKLQDVNPIIRRNAAGALRLNGARAILALPALMNLLSDEDPRVRGEATQAVNHLRSLRPRVAA
jgi:HEAT repeat protein